MAFSLVTPIVDPIGPEGALVSALSRNVEPFVATPLGYDTVILSWKMPDNNAWDGIRITRSRTGFPRTYDDGMTVVLFESEDWYTRPAYHDFYVLAGDGTRAPIGGYHYFSIFLKNAFGWIKVSEQDALVPYDFNSTDRLWDTIPEYYKIIRDDSADMSLVNLRINADLYDGVAGGSAPNLTLSGFLHLFGWGFDILRTQTDYLKNGYDPSVIHPERLKLLARQFGYEPEVAVPAHVNRTILRNLAALYRKRGTIDGIKDTVTAMSGWDADVYLGHNRLLSKEMAALTAPEIPEWDPTVRYPVSTLVKRNNWIYISTQVNLGEAAHEKRPI